MVGVVVSRGNAQPHEYCVAKCVNSLAPTRRAKDLNKSVGESVNKIERCKEDKCSKPVWGFNLHSHVAETHNGTREWCKPAALAKSNLAAIAQKELSKAIVTRKRKSSTTKGPKPKRKKVVKVEPSSIEAAAVAQNNSVADNTVIKTEPPDNAIELSSEQAKKWAQSMMMGGFSR